MPELRIENFDSSVLKRRRKVRVWLPDEYAAQPDARFPVLYTADAQLKFSDRDEELPYGSWRLDEWLIRLAREGRIRPAVVVGVDNSPARMKEYFPVTPEFDNYERFLLEELIPWSREELRLLDAPEHTAHLGSSMGGLVSFALAANNPEVFGTALCFSPWFEHEQNRYIHERLRAMQEMPPIRVYMDSGIFDWRGLDDGHRGMLLARLEMLRLGFTEGEDLDWMIDTWFPSAEDFEDSPVKPDKRQPGRGNQHNEFQWNRRLERPLLYFLGR